MTIWQTVNTDNIMSFVEFIKMMVCILVYTLFALWVCLALWIHMPIGQLTYVLMILVVAMAILSLWDFDYLQNLSKITHITYRKLAFWTMIAGVFIWFFAMSPSNDKHWQDEFRHQFTYTKNDNIITINHVRNFDWHGDTYTERWESRQYNLNHLNSLYMISTTWGNDNIAHIMLSFGFDDGMGDTDKLVFSVETRKETNEDFSTIGGFFRLYELSIIAGDEKDLIYTRTNIRKESVSIYPIIYNKAKIKQLFLTYLDYGQSLNHKPKFYNSLFSNCTTVIYTMVKGIDNVPMDYRIIASGRLADYLYDKGVIDNNHAFDTWKQSAFANPKVEHLGNHTPISSKEYSKLIRQGLPNN